MLSLNLSPVISGCSCHPSGVNTSECPPNQGACICDPDSGTCPCLPNVTGRTCDHCADGYWNLIPGRGCQPCDCDPRTSHGSHCDQARYFRVTKLILSISCPFSRISHFFKRRCFLSLGNGTRNQDLGTRWPCLFYRLPSTPHTRNCQMWNKLEDLHMTGWLPNSGGTPNAHGITLWHAS